jgi:hypothetical protein
MVSETRTRVRFGLAKIGTYETFRFIVSIGTVLQKENNAIPYVSASDQAPGRLNALVLTILNPEQMGYRCAIRYEESGGQSRLYVGQLAISK